MATGKPTLHQFLMDGIDITDYVSSAGITREFSQAISKSDIQIKKTIEADLGILFNDDNVYHTIEIWRGVLSATETRIFKGEVLTFAKEGYNILCSCVNRYQEAVRTEVTVSFDANIDSEAGVISEIFKTLINTYTDLTADNTSVTNSGTTNILKKVICNHASVFERVNYLANTIDWQTYYSDSIDKVYFEPRGNPNSTDILEVGVNIIKKPKWDTDASELRNRVVIIGGEEIVETTETGRVGVTDGYTTTYVQLDKKPYSVKVYSDASNPPTTLRTGGNESTSVYDYSVDVINDKIIWNTGTYAPIANDYVIVNYSYRVPRPVVARNAGSITTYGERSKSFFKSDLKDVDDVESYAKTYVKRYSTPFVSSTLQVVNVDLVYPGQTIRCIDSIEGLDKYLLVNRVTMYYPYKYDEIVVGDKILRTSDWGTAISTRIRRLEEEQGKSQDILTQVLDFSKTMDLHRRYTMVQKKTYPYPSSNIFILSSRFYGILGTNKLGDSTGVSFSTIALNQGNNIYKEYFRDTTFKDAGNTTADWDTANKWIAFDANEVMQTSSLVTSNGNLGTATLTLDETLITNPTRLTYYASANGGSTWLTITNGGTVTFLGGDLGTDLRFKVVCSAVGTAKIATISGNIITPIKLAYTFA
jgi:hypothetical protein